MKLLILVCAVGFMRVSNAQNVIGMMENILYQNERSLYSSVNSLEASIHQIANSFLDNLNRGIVSMWPSVFQVPAKHKSLTNDADIISKMQTFVGKIKTVKETIVELTDREFQALDRSINKTVNAWREIILSASHFFLTSLSPKVGICLRTYEGTYSRLISQAYNALSACPRQITQFSAALSRNYSGDVRSYQSFISKLSSSLRLCSSRSSPEDAKSCVINGFDSNDASQLLDDFNIKANEFSLNGIASCLETAGEIYTLNISMIQDLMQGCLNPIDLSELDLDYDFDVDIDDDKDDNDGDDELESDDRFFNPVFTNNLLKPKEEIKPISEDDFNRNVNSSQINEFEVITFNLFENATVID